MTKAKQIREFANNNASATPQEIADACGVTRIYVYQVLHKMKNKKAQFENVITGIPVLIIIIFLFQVFLLQLWRNRKRFVPRFLPRRR